MSYSTYTDIYTRITEMSEDVSQEFIDYIPAAIRAAELRMTKEIDTLALKQNLEVNTAIGIRTVAKPEGFRFAHDVFMYDSSTGIEKRLKNVTDDYLRDYWPKPNLTAEPRYYAPDYDNDNMLIAPTPDKVYVLRISCGADLTPLSSSNQENYFSKHAGEVLFYAAMVEMATFNRNAQQAADFENKYQNGILSLNNQGRRERRDDGLPPLNPSGGGNTLKGDK